MIIGEEGVERERERESPAVFVFILLGRGSRAERGPHSPAARVGPAQLKAGPLSEFFGGNDSPQSSLLNSSLPLSLFW